MEGEGMERKERGWGRPSGFAPPEKFPSYMPLGSPHAYLMCVSWLRLRSAPSDCALNEGMCNHKIKITGNCRNKTTKFPASQNRNVNECKSYVKDSFTTYRGDLQLSEAVVSWTTMCPCLVEVYSSSHHHRLHHQSSTDCQRSETIRPPPAATSIPLSW